MPRKKKELVTIEEYWNKIIRKPPPIEDLDTAGSNRHRRECFNIALKLCRSAPTSATELSLFMEEYVRQLIGPEIYDLYNNYQEGLSPIRIYKDIRKYTLGA